MKLRPKTGVSSETSTSWLERKTEFDVFFGVVSPALDPLEALLDTVKLKEFAERLRQLRSVIEALESDRRGSSDVVELDQARTGRLSRMDALQAQQMAKAGHVRSKIELQRIEAALRRIESGDFGYCIECENLILLARLEANPTVTLCLACAAAREN